MTKELKLTTGMAKDPAFLFYPNDWMGGTMTLSRHQKGCYMDLLVAQFNNGPLSMETIKSLLGADQGAWSVLQKKFKADSDGNFYNERLEFERLKRQEFSKKQRENGAKGGRKPKPNPDETQTEPKPFAKRSPSISISNSKEDVVGDPRFESVVEMFRRTTQWDINIITLEAGKLLNKYPLVPANQLGPLVNAWSANYREVSTKRKLSI